MPFSASRPPDELAKDLYPYLAHHYRHGELVRLGWFDFVNDHCPTEDDADAVVVAFEAFVFLFLDGGVWNQHTAGLSAILAFLRDQTTKSPSTAQVGALRTILITPPVDESALEDWFYLVFS
jgi:hypothetical protein